MMRAFSKSLFYTVGLFLLLTLLLPSCATTDLYSRPAVQYHNEGGLQHPVVAASRLKVMTLNVAHGRGESFHQLLQPTDETVKNLDSISTLLKHTAPDVIALQEVDGPSFWSGNFNHLEYMANKSVFTHSVQAAHVDAIGLAYGTALMSRLDLSDPQAVTFDPSLSPVPKGFVVSTVNWPGREDIDIDVVSVHLDFMSGAVRKKQADEMIALLRTRNNHLVIMGDLNAGWQRQDSAAQYLVEQLGLAAYQPENNELVTFPAFDERLDWILISSNLEFHSHAVVGEGLSDHHGVVAELRLSNR